MYCNRSLRQRGRHESVCRSNPSRVPCIPWNKGKTKETDDRVRQCGNTLRNRWASGEVKIGGHKHTEATKRRLSTVAKERKLGGYKRGSGVGKFGWYKGVYCDSSWELAYVIYCMDHGIPIERCTERRKYVYGGKTKTYIPDFLVRHYRVVEVKGYCSEQWKAKMKYNPDVEVLYEEEMKHIIEYVSSRYGSNFVEMYE